MQSPAITPVSPRRTIAKMQKMRLLTVSLGAMALVSAALAQFDGPAPLAWRWVQPTSVAPGGSPLVNNDLIYQSVGGRIFCIEKKTGNLKWRFPQLDPIAGTFRTSPILAGGTILAAGDNKIVYAIDPVTGQSKWSANLPEGILGSPVLVGAYLVVALSTNELYALNVTDGTPVWPDSAPTFKVFEGLQGTITASGPDVLYFNGHNQMIALNIVSRKIDWHQEFSQLPPNPGAFVTTDAIYVNSGPYLISLNPISGVARWQANTEVQLAFTPIASASKIVVVSQDGKAFVFDAASRKAINRAPIDLGSLPMTAPTLLGDKFVIPTANGAINLIDPTKTGPLWEYIVRPLADSVVSTGTRTNGPGGRGGGFGGGQAGGGLGGGQQKPEKISEIQAAAPAVLDGQTLLVPARDGSLLAFDRDLGVDLTPPEVKMQFPNSGDQVSGQAPLVLQFKVTDDNSGLRNDSVKITINGQPVDFIPNKDGTILVRFSRTGGPSGRNKPLSDGRKDIIVTASDWMGNEIKKPFSLAIDNSLPPIVIPGQEKPNNGLNGAGGPGKGGGGGTGSDGG